MCHKVFHSAAGELMQQQEVHHFSERLKTQGPEPNNLCRFFKKCKYFYNFTTPLF
jgi:hypothetical protein